MSSRLLCGLAQPKPAGRPERLLLRDYIRKSLYDPNHGYFSNSTSPVLRHKSPIRISSIANRNAYQQAVAATYASQNHGWMTPVELFSPFLSRAIAHRLRSVAPAHGRVNIIEIGAGRGTLARDVLSCWKDDKAFLSRVSYCVVEISHALAALQRRALGRWVQCGVAHVYLADAVSWFSSLKESPGLRDALRDGHCHIVATELLDNLPHDLVREGSSGLEQAEVVISEDGERSEKWISQVDSETYEALKAYDVLDGLSSRLVSENLSLEARLRRAFEALLDCGKRDIWVPTASYQLFRAIVQALPRASITLGDFASFPGSLPGVNGPVVQSVRRGSAVVYDDVHSSPFGKVDIMFPTDFDMLQRGHSYLSSRVPDVSFLSRVVSQQGFFEEYATEQDKQSSTCLDGYNPVLQDFENASFLLVDALRKKAP